MRKAFAMVFVSGLLVFGGSPSLAVTPGQELTLSAGPAPADEYFGGQKLSYLGIRNIIRDQGRCFQADPARAKDVLARTAPVESAMRDWEHKYPGDRELPRQIYLLERLYATIATPEAQAREALIREWLFGAYGWSSQAERLRSELH